MATSQMTAAATSGRYMSDLVKSVSPALKLMNVLTTATDASEIPSSRTRPDVCRTNSLVDVVPPALAAPAGTDASLLVTGLPPAAASPGRGMPEPGQQDALPAQTAPQADLMVRPGQEIVNTYEHIVTNQARITSDGPLAAGSTIVYRGTFLGRHYDTHVECTGLTENKHFATRTTSGPFYLETDAVLEPVAEGTRVTTTYRGEPRVLQAGRAARRPAEQEALENAADNLRALLEDHAI